MGGEINIELPDEEYNITLYKEMLNIKVISIEEGNFSFKIRADNGTSGTIIALRFFNQDTFSDISVKYDGELIEKADFVDIFNLLGNESKAKYTRILTEDNTMYCLIYIPHFSEHIITISSIIEEVVEVLGGPIAVLLYISILLVGTSAFVYPFVVWPARLRKGKKF